MNIRHFLKAIGATQSTTDHRMFEIILDDGEKTFLHVCGEGRRINVEHDFSAETLCIVSFEGFAYAIRQGDFLDYETCSGPIRTTASWKAKAKYNGTPTRRMMEKIGGQPLFPVSDREIRARLLTAKKT